MKETTHHYAEAGTLAACGQLADGIHHTTHSRDVLEAFATLDEGHAVDVCPTCLAVVLERDMLAPGRALAVSLERLRQSVGASIKDIVDHGPGLTAELVTSALADDAPDLGTLGQVAAALGRFMPEPQR